MTQVTPIDPYVQGNAEINLNGALSQLFYLFQTKSGKAPILIDSITVAYYCGVVSCRRDDVLLSGERHKAIAQALSACMTFARNPENGAVDLRRREQIAVLIAHAIGDYAYETRRQDHAVIDRST